MSDEVAKFILPKMMNEIREALGLTKVEMSVRADISRQSITYYEAGKTVPNLDSTGKWLKAVTKEIRRLRRKAAKAEKQKKLG